MTGAEALGQGRLVAAASACAAAIVFIAAVAIGTTSAHTSVDRVALARAGDHRVLSQQRLLRKQLMSAFPQTLALAQTPDRTSQALSMKRYIRDPDDKIKVWDASSSHRDSGRWNKIFGLGPFGEDGMGLAAEPLKVALVNHLLPHS